MIIDDPNKLDLNAAEEIYKRHIKALTSPGFQVILTIPISALREGSLRAMLVSEVDDKIVELPVAKLLPKGERRKANPMPVQEVQDKLCDILNKRIPRPIIDPEAAEQIAFYSGGVLRELIRITNICCRICLRQIRRSLDRTDIVINEAVLMETIKGMRLDFETPLDRADYEILQTTYKKFNPDYPKEQKFLDLLHGLHILEYRNDEVWYDAHPIVADLLKRKGLADD